MDDLGRFSIPAGAPTVLLVEDEEDVRGILEKMLSDAGYKVLPAESANAALSIADSHEGAIDIILADVYLPKMNGVTLARKVREKRPEIRIVCMSGYTSEAIGDHAVSEMGGIFVMKPVKRDDLLAGLREAKVPV